MIVYVDSGLINSLNELVFFSKAYLLQATCEITRIKIEKNILCFST